MNCHAGISNQDQRDAGKDHRRHGLHLLLMILCCALPIVLILLLPALRINNAALQSVLSYAMLLLCPAMHILMIPAMLREDKKKRECDNSDGTP